MVSPLNSFVPMSAGFSAPFHFSKEMALDRTRSCGQKDLVWKCYTEPAPLRPAIPLAAEKSVRARSLAENLISFRR